MTEVKTYLPVSLTMSELARYGENHDDAWVREMAKYVRETCEAINSSNYLRVNTLTELIDAYESDVREFDSALRFAEEELEEEQQKRAEAMDRYESLKFDLDKDEQVTVIRNQKAELLARSESIRRLNQQSSAKQNEINTLRQQLDEIKEKLNMWTIMNKV